MKLLLIIAMVALSGCKAIEERSYAYAVVEGKVYSGGYECEFGALYHQYYEKTLMRDANDNIVKCTNVRLTQSQYKKYKREIGDL